MKHRIVRKIARADAELVETLGLQGVATIHEAQGRAGLMRPYIRPIYPSARMAGSAVTVLAPPGDNLMIHAAIEVCQPGDALVVAPGDRIPVDGLVQSGQSELDNALITGETALAPVAAGARLHAGALNLSGRLVMTATARTRSVR